MLYATDLIQQEEATRNLEALTATGQRLTAVLDAFKLTFEPCEQGENNAVRWFTITPTGKTTLSALQKKAVDIALRLGVPSCTITRDTASFDRIKIELAKVDAVPFRIVSALFNVSNNPNDLRLCIGQASDGSPFFYDFGSLPHLLVAGTTGSGKSVFLKSMITQLAFKTCAGFALIDTKRTEFSIFDGFNNVMCLNGVAYDRRKALNYLQSFENEMRRRYEVLRVAKCANIDELNRKEQRKRYNHIFLVIDELADLMIDKTIKADIERLICSIAQLGRASGVHLIVATQRPDTSVITGLIKANIPSRLAFRLPTKLDSRIILDENGAETLAKAGEMIFKPISGGLYRLTAPLITTEELKTIVSKNGPQEKPKQKPLQKLLNFLR